MIPELPAFETCPTCGRELAEMIVYCGSHRFAVRGQCFEHGEVTAMRRAVVNRYPDTGLVWDGEGP